MGVFGNFIGAVWFFMLFLAAITSSISMYQPSLAFFRSAGLEPQSTRPTLMVAICVGGSVPAHCYFSRGRHLLVDDR